MKQLDDFKINVKLKISALWISVMFCYLYADYFGLYVPGNLQRMLEGRMGPLGQTTQGVLLFTSAMMAIGGLGYVTDSFASLLSPALAGRLPDLAFLGGVAELALCLWLMIVGLNAPKWEERAQ